MFSILVSSAHLGLVAPSCIFVCKSRLSYGLLTLEKTFVNLKMTTLTIHIYKGQFHLVIISVLALSLSLLTASP